MSKIGLSVAVKFLALSSSKFSKEKEADALKEIFEK